MAAQVDELGVFTGLQLVRKTYARFVERRVLSAIDTPAVRRFITHAVDEKIKAEIDAIFARRLADARAEIEGVSPMPGPQILVILHAVSTASGFSVAELVGPRRPRRLSRARQMAYYLVKTIRTDLSLPMIGRAFGNRDHTTIMHGLKVVEECRDAEPIKTWLDHPAIVALIVDKGS